MQYQTALVNILSRACHRSRVGGWRNGGTDEESDGAIALCGQLVPHLVPACLSVCSPASLHGRILAAFHKTSSALPVAPATLHHDHAAMPAMPVILLRRNRPLISQVPRSHYDSR